MKPSKIFEVRDKGTRLTVIAFRADPDNEAERWLLSDAGYTRQPETQREYVFMTANLRGGDNLGIQFDPHAWKTGTMTLAHEHIQKNFDKLNTGDVICCEFLRGERATPKTADRLDAGEESVA